MKEIDHLNSFQLILLVFFKIVISSRKRAKFLKNLEFIQTKCGSHSHFDFFPTKWVGNCYYKLTMKSSYWMSNKLYISSTIGVFIIEIKLYP